MSCFKNAKRVIKAKRKKYRDYEATTLTTAWPKFNNTPLRIVIVSYFMGTPARKGGIDLDYKAGLFKARFKLTQN